MHDMLSLIDWPNTVDCEVVAFSANATFTTAQLLERSSCWYNTLESQSGRRWAVFHTDAFEFFAIVFALWKLQRVACVPGDNKPGTVKRLSPHVDGYIGQFADAPTVKLETTGNDSSRISNSIIDAQLPALEIYTSGSTGKPKAILKTVAQLQGELVALESLWPSTPREPVFATVSHQHLYGLTFRLLWPLVTHRPFTAHACEYTEDLHHQASSHDNFCLVSSPSHLGRLNPALDWSVLHSKCRSVTSSTAPLEREDSLKVSKLLGCAVREIYGSSETGAIAWREQNEKKEALWRPLPGVSLSQSNDDDTLLVNAPYLGNSSNLSLADRVSFTSNNEFFLLGRADRIAKIEGKRISLPAVESQLHAHHFIDSCRALVTRRKRDELAIVLVLNRSGEQALFENGYKFLVSTLRQHLASEYEPVLLPRRWRLVDELPVNAQGKVPLPELECLFSADQVNAPVVLSSSVSAEKANLYLFLPHNLIYFDGHFTNAPILPGVVQIHFAIDIACRLFSLTQQFSRLEAVKFQQLIAPRELLSLELSYNAVKNKVLFQYMSRKGVHSSGRVCFK